ncbi:hypothetical protein [Algoriphagus terrigena]|uniref:hypothetical protein n=1 Tax=Algoriphagus terrigena TaxID=344884 RepID=UPI000428450B|nr:hypothetical protein [Algoriphagus terrigena]
MTDKESQESRNEIMVLLKPNSGVSLKSGLFHSQNPEQVERINGLLKEHRSEVRKLDVQTNQEKPGEASRLLDYHQIYYPGDATQLLEALRNEEWVESAYLKPKSEDPGSF